MVREFSVYTVYSLVGPLIATGLDRTTKGGPQNTQKNTEDTEGKKILGPGNVLVSTDV